MKACSPSLVAILALAACTAQAKTSTATPATLQTVLDNANAGDTIRLAAGEYESVVVSGRKWARPVVVEAGAARLKGVGVYGTSGLTWRGGTFDGGGTLKYGFIANKRSDHIEVDGATFRNFTRNGIGFGKVSDVRITNNVLTDMGSDGIDLALSQRAVVSGNSCRDFKPSEKAHPDCIQMFSRPGDVMADITITNNTMEGDMQGIVLFNKTRDGVNDGGADRIVVSDNIIRIKQFHGIFLSECRDCTVRNNRVESLPDTRSRAWIKFREGTVAACGNKIDGNNGPETKPCRG